jgi:crotonobetainyl-CoA:carnitine CoA-transferase CaiB-like acyl-CoA transferase
VRVGIAISDTAAGMFLGQGILLALLHRERTGEGQWVHTSLLESMLNKLDFQGARYTMNGDVPAQQGNFHPTQVPMGTFPSRDGLVNIAASTGKMFVSFCRALGAEALLDDPDFADSKSRVRNRERLNAEIASLTRTFATADLVAKLNPAGVPCGPINDIGQAFEDPQVKHLHMTRVAHHRTLGDVALLRSPINLSRVPQPADFARAAPDPGEHTAEVLAEHGFDDATIRRLFAEGAVA